MKQMKEIREKTTDAIQAELRDAQRLLFDMRTQAVTEKLEAPSRLRETRKAIARMKTVLRERELAARKRPPQPAGPASQDVPQQQKEEAGR